MRQKLLLFLLLTGLSVILLGSPPPSEANIITVDGICTLADAIIAANTDTTTGNCPAGSIGADTIVLDVDVSLTSVYPGSTAIGGGQSGLPDITSDITIQAGLQETIDANNMNFRHIYVAPSGSLTLAGVFVDHGRLQQPGSSAYGGSIYVDGSLTLIDAWLTNNQVNGDITRGGAIYVGTSGSLTITGDHVIVGNESNGVVFGDGGAIYTEGTIVSISGGLIAGNVATGSGGAIYADTINSISSTEFASNEAGDSGGAISAVFIDSIDNSVFSGFNFAISGNGGAIALSEGFTFINETAFQENHSVFGSGGGLWVNSTGGATGTISDSLFNYENCSGQDGNLIWLGSSSIVSITGTTFREVICSGTPTSSGGMIYSEGELNISNSTFDHGFVPTNTGGAIHNENGSLTVQDSVFSENSIAGDTFAAGGAIYSVGVLTVLRSEFNDNFAYLYDTVNGEAKGGAIYSEGQAEIAENTFFDNRIQSNEASMNKSGGTIYAEGQADITNNDFQFSFVVYGPSDDSPDGNGGTIYLNVTQASTVRHNTFRGGIALNGEVLHASGPVDVNGNIIASLVSNPDCTLLAGVTGVNNLHLAGDTSCDTISAGTIDPMVHMNGSLLASVFGNPAIDGNPGCGLATDGLGNPRIGACDIGYHELQLSSPTPTPVPPTDTPVPPTDTPIPPTDTPVPPTNTPIPPTDTPVPPTDTLIPPTDTTVPPTDTPIPPTDTPGGPTALVVSAICVDENLAVTITSGDGPFDITASAGINTPVNGVSVGTTTINGPERWDDLTVTEQGGDGESINLGQFKCRPLDIPVPLSPAHLSHTTNTSPTFSWTGIPNANRYRLFVFDNKVASQRTVDIRETTPTSATSYVLSNPLPTGRLFWRVRGRVNRVWGYWSIRFTLFLDPPALQGGITPVPTIDLAPPTATPVVPAPAPPTFPPPPNSR
ncbi:MAG: hypothetical protein L0154_00110 [Chloroflexi bacterium]|nr:hypothetical protein [Chloroflexota bacterium]